MESFHTHSKRLLEQLNRIETELRSFAPGLNQPSSGPLTLQEYLFSTFLPLHKSYVSETRIVPLPSVMLRMAAEVWPKNSNAQSLLNQLKAYSQMLQTDRMPLRQLDASLSNQLSDPSIEIKNRLLNILKEIEEEMKVLGYWINPENLEALERESLAMSMSMDRVLQFDLLVTHLKLLNSGQVPKDDPSFHLHSLLNAVRDIPKAKRLTDLLKLYCAQVQTETEMEPQFPTDDEQIQGDDLWDALVPEKYVTESFLRVSNENSYGQYSDLQRSVMNDLMNIRFQKLLKLKDMIEVEIYCSHDLPMQNKPFRFFFRGYGVPFLLQEHPYSEIKSEEFILSKLTI